MPLSSVVIAMKLPSQHALPLGELASTASLRGFIGAPKGRMWGRKAFSRGRRCHKGADVGFSLFCALRKSRYETGTPHIHR